MPSDSSNENTLRERVDPELKPGTSVGDYRVEAKLGEGGFGVVYSAVHPLIGKRVAVKVLSRELSSDPEIVKRFEGEARAVNAISHANIVDISNIGSLTDGRHYLVMELLNGESFEDVLSRGRIDPPQLLEVMRGVAGALDAAHAAGVVHRDIKPENIYLHRAPDGRLVPKLLDFGVAKLLGQGLAHHQTTAGAPIGTPRYMSPEQCLARQIDSRTDIYALGVVCFEALSGIPPFDAPSLLELMNQHTLAPRPMLSAIIHELGTSFDAPIARMMAIDRDHRPATAVEAVASIEHAYAALQAARARGRNTPTDMMMAPVVSPSSSGPWPPQREPEPSYDSFPSHDALAADDAQERDAPTLVRPSQQGFPGPFAVTAGTPPVSASTMVGIGPRDEMPSSDGPLATRKPTTLGATSSSLDLRLGGARNRNRAALALVALTAVLVSVVAVVVMVSTGETEAVVTPDEPTAASEGVGAEPPRPGVQPPSSPAASVPASQLDLASATPSASTSSRKKGRAPIRPRANPPNPPNPPKPPKPPKPPDPFAYP